MDIGSLVEHLSVGLVIQADAGTAARCLSTSGLTYDTECFTFINGKRNIIDSLYNRSVFLKQFFISIKKFLYIFYFQDHIIFHRLHRLYLHTGST